MLSAGRDKEEPTIGFSLCRPLPLPPSWWRSPGAISMNQASKIETFWQDYLSTLSEPDRKHAPAYHVDKFADTPEAATKVGKLVRDGIKTTSSSLLERERKMHDSYSRL
jgi:hypothetical protein